MAQDPFQRNYKSTTERFTAPCGIEVFTYVGDIIAVPGATAAVTGEGREFSEESFITQSLLETCPGLHRTRNKLKKKYGKFKSWTVRTSKLDHESKFRYIFHAVLGPRTDDNWVRGMKKLYKALFKKAEKYKVTSLALPLLCSGRSGVDVSAAVQAVTESITLIRKHSHLSKIYLVTLDKQNADEMATLYQKNFQNPSDVPPRLRRSLRYKLGWGGRKYRERKDNKRCDINSQDQSYSKQSSSTTFPGRSEKRQQTKSGSIGRNPSKSRPTFTPSFFTAPQQQSQPAHNAQINHQQASQHSLSTRNAQVGQQQASHHSLLTQNAQVSHQQASHDFHSTQNVQVHHLKGSCQSNFTQNAEVNNQQSYQEYQSMHTVQVHGQKPIQRTNIGHRKQSQPPQNVNGQTQKPFEPEHHLSSRIQNAQIQRNGGRKTAQLTVGQHVRENRNRYEGGFDRQSDQTRNYGEAERVNDIHSRHTRENHIPKSRQGDRADKVCRAERNDDTTARSEYRGEGKYHAWPENPNFGETGNRRLKETNAENRVSKNEDEFRQKRKNNILETSEKNVTARNKNVVSSENPHHQSLSINCPICLNQVEDPKQLEKCGHVFCRTCIERSFSDFKPVCPSCNMVYGEIRGNQPDGQMDVGFSGEHLPGFEGHGTITITYRFPNGRQKTNDPLQASTLSPDRFRTSQDLIKKQRYVKDLQKLREMAKQKGFTFSEVHRESDIFTTLSEQLTNVLREKIEEGHLRTMVADYLRTCQSTEDKSLEDYLKGATFEDVHTALERGDDVDCQYLISAVCNVMNVEVLLLVASGGEIQEILVQPFSEKEFLPTIVLGTISGKHFISLEHVEGRVFSDIPPTWSRCTKDTEVVTLQSESAEFKEVEQNFLSSLNGLKHSVIQIKRVQSTTQWKYFKISCEEMAKKYPDIIFERRLWHGTSVQSIKTICKEGFNRSLCGKNATRYGEGTYFSKASSYAALDKYSVPGSDGFKYMFRARVLTGHYTKGEQGMKVLPWFDEEALVRFDSVVDNVDKPTMFVIFHDAKAYPEYLIKFT